MAECPIAIDRVNLPPHEGGLWEAAIRQGKAVVYNHGEIAANKVWPHALCHSFAHWISVPIYNDGKIKGVVTMGSNAQP